MCVYTYMLYINMFVYVCIQVINGIVKSSGLVNEYISKLFFPDHSSMKFGSHWQVRYLFFQTMKIISLHNLLETSLKCKEKKGREVVLKRQSF